MEKQEKQKDGTKDITLEESLKMVDDSLEALKEGRVYEL